jgi:hypothetical protein
MDFEGLQPPSRHGVYVENAGEHDANGIPRARERTGPFWTWTAGLLGLEPPRSAILDSDDRDGRPFMLSSVGSYSPLMSDDERLAGMRRREAKLREQNNSSPPQVTAADLVREAATHLTDKLREVVKPRDKARQWLMATLASGPMLAESAKEAAKAQGISRRTLRRAFEAGNFRHIKNAAGRSVWSQPQAGQS